MTPQQTLTNNGIEVESYAPGLHYTICPKCSHTRSAPHRRNKVLGVTIGADGSVCWGCNHCNWTGPEKGNGGEWRELESYLYRDRDGAIRFRKVRNLPGREPRFWLEQPDGDGWKKGTKGVDTKSSLYRVDEVLRAIASGRIVACVEGEKDADNLWRLDIAATCNAHGASETGKKPKWTKAHSEQLSGADIVVFNDNDAPGYAHADAACKLSLCIARRVRRLDLAKHWPEIPKGGDISDWLALGHTREELHALIANAPDYQPQSAGGGANGSGAVDEAAEIERLVRLSALDYERGRKVAAEKLGIRASILDALVKARRAELGLNGDDRQGEAIEFPTPEPWPEPVNGVALLNEIAEALRQHVIMGDAARDACALWVIHTYTIRHFPISPKLFIRSVAKGCGKSTLLEVLSHLVARPLTAANITVATAFRIIAKYKPTLLIDEVDTFLNGNDELRGIIDASHRHDGHVPRLVGDDHEPRNFSVYTAVALSGIGSLHPTLMDRSIIIDLKRRRKDEKITALRIGRTGHLDEIGRRIVRWVTDNEDRIAAIEPAMPDALLNRTGDNWLALLAIADAASGEWPARARKAAQTACAAAGDGEDWLELLLADIRNLFAEVKEVPSAALVEALVESEGRPWAEMGKSQKPLTQHRLARMLKPLGIAPVLIRIVEEGKEKRARGYQLGQFGDAFERYLPQEGDSNYSSVPNATAAGTSDESPTVPEDGAGTVSKSQKSANDGHLEHLNTLKGGDGQEHALNGSESPPGPAELCAHCGGPGGREIGYGDGECLRLHRECEKPWMERRMAEEGHGPGPDRFRRVDTDA